MKTLFISGGAILLLTSVVLAGQPLIVNAVLDPRLLEDDLGSFVESWSKSTTAAGWLGWHVPMIKGDQFLCCGHHWDRLGQTESCGLEDSHLHFVFTFERPRSRVESRNLVVLVRAQDGKVSRIQAYSDGCRLDASGNPMTWLEGVDPEQSVFFLGGLVEDNVEARDEALMALALHAAPQAPAELGQISRHNIDPDLRGEALFWLSQTGSPEAAEVILEAIAHDPDSDVREEAVFALSQLPGQEGIPFLLGIIQDRSQPTDMRQQAFFWYVQEADDEALDLIAEILSN